MAPLNEDQEKNIRRPDGNETDRNHPLKRNPDLPENAAEDNDDESSSPHTDELRKGSFTDRPHGRTNPPLGPDHEPGTL